MTEQRQGEVGGGPAPQTARPRHPERPCLNCGDPTYGEYCPRCGQHKIDVQVSVGAMVKDLLEDEFLLGRRLPHTLVALLFRPGFLTVEVLRGRIVRYVRPFKLYLASSVVFFLVLSFISVRALEVDPTSALEGVEVTVGDSTSMGLAQLDSAIAELDARLEAPDMNTGTALALSTTRAVLASQREQLLAQQDSSATAPVRVEDDGGGRIQLPEIHTGIARVDSVLEARARRLESMESGDALRLDLASRRIRVSTVYPRATDTTIFEGVPGDWQREHMNRPEDVAEVIWRAYRAPPGADVAVHPQGAPHRPVRPGGALVPATHDDPVGTEQGDAVPGGPDLHKPPGPQHRNRPLAHPVGRPVGPGAEEGARLHVGRVARDEGRDPADVRVGHAGCIGIHALRDGVP